MPIFDTLLLYLPAVVQLTKLMDGVEILLAQFLYPNISLDCLPKMLSKSAFVFVSAHLGCHFFLESAR